MTIPRLILPAILLAALVAPAAAAPKSDEIASLRAELAALTERLAKLENAPPAMAPAPAVPPAKVNNLDTSVIFDTVASRSNLELGVPDDGVHLREAEINFSQWVDTHAKADLVLAVGQEDGEYVTDIEEGYLTLPYFMKRGALKFGKFFAHAGHANTYHLHALPWVDVPLALRNLFGEEGLKGSGLSLSYHLPSRGNGMTELVYEPIVNDNPVAFAGAQGDNLVHLGHVKHFIELGSGATLELGATAGVGRNNPDVIGDRTKVSGFDVTYKYRPENAALYRSFQVMAEYLRLDMDKTGIGRSRPGGAFVGVDWQFDRNWQVGTRLDRSGVPYAPDSDRAASLHLTYLQSEYCFWRLNFERRNWDATHPGERPENVVTLQCNFGIGPHRAHQY